MKRFSILWATLALLIFIVGFFLTTGYGTSLRYSADSIWLRSLAVNFGLGNGLVGPDGEELIYWVPLYPLLLSIWYEKIDLFALMINFVSIIGVFVLSSITFKEELKKPNSQLIYTTSLVLSTPLLMISTFFWTESIFLFFLILFIYGLVNYLDTGTKIYLVTCIVSGWLMLMFRNAGIFFIPGAVIWIVLQKEQRLREKLSFLLILALICSGFVSWNFYKLIILSNGNVIEELLPVFTPASNIKLVTNEIGKYIVPDIGFYFSNLVGASFIAGVIYMAIKSDGRNISVAYFIILSYIFTFFIIPPDPSELSRYLAPVIPIILVVSTGFWSNLLQSNRLNPWFSRMLVLSMYSYLVVRIIKNITVWAHIDIYNYLKFV